MPGCRNNNLCEFKYHNFSIDDVTGNRRSFLTKISGLVFGNIVARLSEPDAGPTDERRQFNALAMEDIVKSRIALALVRAQSRISSELIDNLNASIHLRTVLTNLWLLSETLETGS